jgi:hypothetical protein
VIQGETIMKNVATFVFAFLTLSLAACADSAAPVEEKKVEETVPATEAAPVATEAPAAVETVAVPASETTPAPAADAKAAPAATTEKH